MRSGAESLIGFNLVPLGLGVSSIYSPAIAQQNYSVPVSGLYSVAFYPGHDPQSGAYAPFSIAQRGDEPANAEFIRFINFGSPMELSISGTVVPLTYDYLPGSTNLNTRVADVFGDISSFAGRKNVELRFTTLNLPGATLSGLDSIEFQSVPEPGAISVIAFGAAGFLPWRWRLRA